MGPKVEEDEFPQPNLELDHVGGHEPVGVVELVGNSQGHAPGDLKLLDEVLILESESGAFGTLASHLGSQVQLKLEGVGVCGRVPGDAQNFSPELLQDPGIA